MRFITVAGGEGGVHTDGGPTMVLQHSPDMKPIPVSPNGHSHLLEVIVTHCQMTSEEINCYKHNDPNKSL